MRVKIVAHSQTKRYSLFILIYATGLVIALLGVWLFLQKSKQAVSGPDQSVCDAVCEQRKKASKALKEAAASKAMVTLPGSSAVFEAKRPYLENATGLWTLINKDHSLAEPHYKPSDLVVDAVNARADKSTEERSVRQVIVLDLQKMFGDAKAAGHELMLASGFRSYELQNTYFSNYARKSGEEQANLYSARPGQSEHQTGFSLDISLVSKQCYLDVCFGETDAGKWLAAHAHEYGFILRYPSDKTDITKYQYEPWHFRYVGKVLATALYESKLTLEEAYPYIKTSLDKSGL